MVRKPKTNATLGLPHQSKIVTIHRATTSIKPLEGERDSELDVKREKDEIAQ
jgi:hypothetical protein